MILTATGCRIGGNCNTLATLIAMGTGDWDGDGLIDLAEFEYGTDPTNPDSDGDGFSDGDEVGAGTDPNDPQSHPTDKHALDTAAPA